MCYAMFAHNIKGTIRIPCEISREYPENIAGIFALLWYKWRGESFLIPRRANDDI